jgi:DNA primase
LFREGLEVKIAALPPGSDPDSAIREKGADFVTAALRDAQGYVKYRVGRARETLRAGGLLEQETVIKELLATAAAVDDTIRRALLIRRIAAATGIAEANLIAQLPARKGDRSSPAPQHSAPKKAGHWRDRWEAEFIRLLLEKPEYINKIKAEIRSSDFQQPLLAQMYKTLIELPRIPETLKPADLGQTTEEKSAWIRIAVMELGPETDERVLGDYVKKLTANRPREMAAELKRRISEAEARGDHQEADRLVRKLAEKHLTEEQE